MVQDVLDLERVGPLVKSLDSPARTVPSRVSDTFVHPPRRSGGSLRRRASIACFSHDDLPPVGGFRPPPVPARAQGGLAVETREEEGQGLVGKSVPRVRQPALARRAKEVGRTRRGDSFPCLAGGLAKAAMAGGLPSDRAAQRDAAGTEGAPRRSRATARGEPYRARRPAGPHPRQRTTRALVRLPRLHHLRRSWGQGVAGELPHPPRSPRRSGWRRSHNAGRSFREHQIDNNL